MLLRIIIIVLLGAFVAFLPIQQSVQQSAAIPDLPEEIVQQLYDLGVIDKSKAPGEMSMLNLYWAFGLANKNEILEKGPMMDPQYGGADNFASTGGWTIAVGNAMDHYGMHRIVELTPDQQKLVEEVSRNIYRPCCGNSTYFPDCNHGMAMLGLLEFMASQGKSEKEMYQAGLAANMAWFPDTYQTIAKYMESKGVAWDEADPKTLLSYDFSSGAGFQKIKSQVAPVEPQNGASCEV